MSPDAWRGNTATSLNVYANNKLMFKSVIVGTGSGRQWRDVMAELGEFAGRMVTLRLYQRVLVPNQTAGNAYWRSIDLE